jgi:hypothetical protein
MARLQTGKARRNGQMWKRFICYCSKSATIRTKHPKTPTVVWQGRQKVPAIEPLGSLDGEHEDQPQNTIQLSTSFVFESLGPAVSGLIHFWRRWASTPRWAGCARRALLVHARRRRVAPGWLRSTHRENQDGAEGLADSIVLVETYKLRGGGGRGFGLGGPGRSVEEVDGRR